MFSILGEFSQKTIADAFGVKAKEQINPNFKFKEDGKHDYETKDGKQYCYGSNDKICGVWEDSVYTGFHNFEKQEISRILNAKDDGTIISINDLYGNVYDLKKDEIIQFIVDLKMKYF